MEVLQCVQYLQAEEGDIYDTSSVPVEAMFRGCHPAVTQLASSDPWGKTPELHVEDLTVYARRGAHGRLYSKKSKPGATCRKKQNSRSGLELWLGLGLGEIV